MKLTEATDVTVEGVTDKYETVELLAAAHKELQGKLGEYGNTHLKLPGENPSSEELADLRKVLGAGASADDYGVTHIEDEALQKLLAGSREAAFNANTPRSAWDAMTKSIADVLHQQEAEETTTNKTAREAADRALRETWGNDYETNAALAERMGNRVKEKVPGLNVDISDPNWRFFLGEFARQNGEDTLPASLGGTVLSTETSKGEALDKARKARALMESADYNLTSLAPEDKAKKRIAHREFSRLCKDVMDAGYADGIFDEKLGLIAADGE